MWAHPTWQRPLWDVTSPFFSLQTSTSPVTSSPYIAFASSRLPRSLRSNNYRNFHPIIINTRESSREAGQTGIPRSGRPRFVTSPGTSKTRLKTPDRSPVSYLTLQRADLPPPYTDPGESNLLQKSTRSSHPSDRNLRIRKQTLVSHKSGQRGIHRAEIEERRIRSANYTENPYQLRRILDLEGKGRWV